VSVAPLPDRLLTARMVADMLGVSTETILRWTRKGKLPAIRLPGGAIRYRPAALEDWLASRETTSSTPGRVSSVLHTADAVTGRGAP
jgi:excisionase family DNA binding protein